MAGDLEAHKPLLSVLELYNSWYEGDVYMAFQWKSTSTATFRWLPQIYCEQ